MPTPECLSPKRKLERGQSHGYQLTRIEMNKMDAEKITIAHSDRISIETDPDGSQSITIGAAFVENMRRLQLRG